MMAGVACVSVLENNKDMSFVFHIFTDGYSKDSQEKINELLNNAVYLYLVSTKYDAF